MKTIRFRAATAFVLFSLVTMTVSLAQITTPTSSVAGGAMKDAPGTPAAPAQDNSAITHLDNAVTALAKGDKAATTGELQAGISGLETQAQQQPTSFKTKLLAQASKLKTLLPLIPTGALGTGVLGKAVNLAKLAFGGNQLESILAAGSLLGKGSQLTSGLSGIGSALSALGGKSSGQPLIASALATVGKLDQGGLAAEVAEPAAKTELSSILNLIKGAL